MKTQLSAVMALIFGLSVMWSQAIGQPPPLPMPPGFNLNSDPVKVLANYPLGVIGQDAAFSHHGKANKTFTLPNGKRGWLYDVGKKEWHRTYTLVFDTDGKVIDVMYYDHGHFSKYGLTALQVQSVEPRTEKPTLGPGPQ